MNLREVNIREIKENAVEMISDEWMLISVGDEKEHNMMTASWGFLGEMWGKDCAIVAVRPTRHTLTLLNKNDTFALVFMGKGHPCHKVCGSLSGRDVDKVSKTGLTPIYSDGTMYFSEARAVLICKKMYEQDLAPENFKDTSLDEKWYNGDYHKMIYGEIVKVLVKE